MGSNTKQVKNAVNKNATPAEPNPNKDESQDLINPVISPDDNQDLGAAASGVVTPIKNPFPAMGDAKKLKSLSLPVVENENIELNIKDQLKAVFEENEIEFSDSFFNSLSNIFEAAVTIKVKEITESYEEIYNEALAEEVYNLKEELEERIDTFLAEACEQWQEENQLAIEYGVKNEITESFIEGLKNLFETHYIEIPEEKCDIVAELEEELDSLKEDFSKVYEDNMILQEDLDITQKQLILLEASKNLTEIEKDKFYALTENLLKENIEYFEKKVNTIKENHFPKYQVDYMSLTEDVLEDGYREDDDVDPIIAKIAQKLV